MPSDSFSIDANYVQSVLGLHQLHALALAGKDDGPEAEALRDSLEPPWQALSEVEKRRITGLSEDLYSLTVACADSNSANGQDNAAIADALSMFRNGQWDDALEGLRACAANCDPALLSYLRGAVWMSAGDYATAAIFFKHAAELDLDNARYACLYVHALDQSNPAAAREQVSAILAAELNLPLGYVMANE